LLVLQVWSNKGQRSRSLPDQMSKKAEVYCSLTAVIEFFLVVVAAVHEGKVYITEYRVTL